MKLMASHLLCPHDQVVHDCAGADWEVTCQGIVHRAGYHQDAAQGGGANGLQGEQRTSGQVKTMYMNRSNHGT